MKATLGTDVTSHLGSSYHSEKTVLARPPSWEFLRKQLPPPPNHGNEAGHPAGLTGTHELCESTMHHAFLNIFSWQEGKAKGKRRTLACYLSCKKEKKETE